ncbi:hypothetical protein FGO68_gene2344 [Halteria grandinella]|uniref:Secreted protein n=1 Tax=Halteria grandinella TaxID=5974 RepID=A0A8J8NQY5_HALGN|nr:hypothetical protein FGO68_gene2344 [Halteria grandinella]
MKEFYVLLILLFRGGKNWCERDEACWESLRFSQGFIEGRASGRVDSRGGFERTEISSTFSSDADERGQSGMRFFTKSKALTFFSHSSMSSAVILAQTPLLRVLKKSLTAH